MVLFQPFSYTSHFTSSASKIHLLLLRYCDLYCVIVIRAEVFVAVTQKLSFVQLFCRTVHFSRRRFDISNFMQKYHTLPNLKDTVTQIKKTTER